MKYWRENNKERIKKRNERKTERKKREIVMSDKQRMNEREED